MLDRVTSFSCIVRSDTSAMFARHGYLTFHLFEDSGHGGQVKAENDVFEKDGYDECIHLLYAHYAYLRPHSSHLPL